MRQLCIIIPTYNERDNISLLIDKLDASLQGTDYEIIVADDNSPDGTWSLVDELAEARTNLFCLRRVGRRGLASAVYEAALLTRARYFAVIDADMQHDETVIPSMLDLALNGADVVVGSRYLKGSEIRNWNRFRQLVSKVGTRITRMLYPDQHDITDIMSGFYLMDRRIFLGCVERLTAGQGFRSLCDILSNYPSGSITIREVPYVFKSRVHGESKIDVREAVQFLEFLYVRRFGRYVPLTFLKFCMVGSAGAALHFLLMYYFYRILLFDYTRALIISIESAILANFLLNNIWTFRTRRIRGLRLVSGLLKYNGAALFGGAIGFIINSHLVAHGLHWVLATLIGAFAGSLWNYILNKIFTWKATD